MPFEDFKIDQDVGDIVLLGTGHFDQVSGAERVAQHVWQRLNTHKGEWFLDLTAGPNWTGSILVKNPSLTKIRTEIASQILAVQDVVLVKSLTVDFDETRQATIEFVAVTTFGTISGVV